MNDIFKKKKLICFFFYGNFDLDALVIGNLVAMIIRTAEFDSNNLEESARIFCASWDTILFLGCKF